MESRTNLWLKKEKPKIGLALGGGSARGLAHIGILKALHQHHIYPDYVAGTSIGAVIGAVYAAGHPPEEMEEIAETTDWKNIIDFTVPKSGLIKGYLIEKRIRKLVHNKNFEDLSFPFRVVAVDLSSEKKVVFRRGNVAKAVRASLAIPGLFAPVKIGKHFYVDGGLIDPTPFDVVREMGADFVIAVDLFQQLKTAPAPHVPGTTFLDELKKKFIAEELLNLKYYLAPRRFPEFVVRLFNKFFDRLLYPQKILRILARKESPPILKIVYQSINLLSSTLAAEKLKNARIDVLIAPEFNSLTWTDFDKTEEFIRLGEEAARKKIPELKRKLRMG